ncbi:MAG: discoidin domain-containing protein [Candidatus Eremiobacteraeota bacterium]|nr:discoidin domain-containing protein [Candidatus Eremiobacteraeota bacterium]
MRSLMRSTIARCAATIAALAFIAASAALADTPHAITIDITPGHALNIFSPVRALGAGIDSQNFGAVDAIYTPANVKAMLSAGLGSLSYRLYTELSVQHWHWNPQGVWSAKTEGYWTGASAGSTTIRHSFGYRLPHRGFTFDQGNNDDYSRLTDGDAATYWKSNPYLARRFTGEPDSAHPQWIVVDLGAAAAVNAVRINWTNPYALTYQVQHWTGADAINDPAHGRWATFPGGAVQDGMGGTVTLKLAGAPISMEFLRIEMTGSSQTCDSHGARDVRNCVGYAIGEVAIGTLDAHGRFHDLVRHAASNSQTPTYVSSVDPWHQPSNRVVDQEQAGIDLVYRSGLTRGLPAMVAVGMLYGTPDDAAAEIRYLEGRHYPISYVELGEEPDGQYILPEDYGALYLQWARAVHAVDPELRLGGPVFQGVTQDVQAWPNAGGDVSWLHRFLEYLWKHERLSDLSFMSFEHYPFDPCDPSYWDDLYTEPAVLQSIMATWRKDGLPHVPMFITETNFSAGAAAAFQDIVGALWFADFEAAFLSNGGSGTFLYQYEPEPLVTSSSNCTSYGAWGMFAADNNNQIRQRTSQFFAAQLLTQQWVEPIDAAQALYPATSRVIDLRGNQLVTNYALLRPDGSWALLLINKDRLAPHNVTVTFRNLLRGTDHYFKGAVAATAFGAAQYVWHPNGANGFANPDGPAVMSLQPGGKGAVYSLEPASITVLRGNVH